MGIFEVSEANRTAHVLELKAYDYMLRFDRDFNGFETIGTAYGNDGAVQHCLRGGVGTAPD